MNIITRQGLADEAPARFSHVYQRGTLTRWTPVVEQLRALGTPVDPDAVDRIIGNRSWTAVPKCDECGAEGLPVVVEVGEEPDYESATARLCLDCLRNAVAMLEAA